MKIFYYTYKITLLKGSLAGHYYYGQHRTKNLNDCYSGSGRIIRDYFKHYDKIEGVTYVKEILHFYNDEAELNIAEKVLIGDKYETDKLCLNLIPGGNGKGRNKGYKHTEETKQKISKSNKGKIISSETREKMSEIAKNRKGRKLSDETKEKIRIAALNRAPISEETKQKISKANKGHTAWNKGLKKIII